MNQPMLERIHDSSGAQLITHLREYYALVLANHGSILQLLCARSYVHENGFTKLYLGDFGIKRIRLHLWEDSEFLPSQNIHGHRFSFTSRVLKGAISDIHFTRARSSTSETFYEFKYFPREHSDTYQMPFVGEAQLEKTETFVISEGDTYTLLLDELHTSEPVSDYPVVTLFIEDRSELATSCPVFSRRYGATAADIASPSLLEQEWLDSYENILLLLEEQ
jgi:hypothetical protein